MKCDYQSCLNNTGGGCQIAGGVSISRTGRCSCSRTQRDVDNKEYARVCLHGFTDCVSNPLYIQKHHPKWWHELGRPTTCTPETCYYDDGDKWRR